MKHWAAAIAATAFASVAAGAVAQTGDPDRTGRQEALAHAVAIQSAWNGVEQRIRVTDAANLWENEWTGLTAPPSGSWWLASWTERGLTARYCDGVLAVYATRDELKGVQREHREVQIAPALYGGGRTGLHVILASTRIAVGAHGRDDAALPNCMAVPSTTGDRVGLVSAVADPIRTVTGYRWQTETRDVPCANSPSDSIREARRMPVQLTSIRGTGETRGRDLAVTDPGNLDIWPADCGLRAGLGPEAQCTDWKRVGGQCPHVFAQAAAPTPIPDPVINWRTGPVHRTTAGCSCPSGETGTCTLHYEQGTEYRDFQVRPGAPVVTTRRIARGDAGRRRLVARIEDCEPIVQSCEDRGDCDHGGPDSENEGPDGGNSGNAEESTAEDDSANEGFGGSSMGPPGSMGNADTPGVTGPGAGGDGDGGGDGSCFLTTAVVGLRGEADDGQTLTTMRRFRDSYMQATPERREMVEGYYRVAPAIVAAIPKDHPDWAWLERKIDASASAFRRGEDDLAFDIMAGAVIRLHDRWLGERAGEQQDG